MSANRTQAWLVEVSRLHQCPLLQVGYHAGIPVIKEAYVVCEDRMSIMTAQLCLMYSASVGPVTLLDSQILLCLGVGNPGLLPGMAAWHCSILNTYLPPQYTDTKRERGREAYRSCLKQSARGMTSYRERFLEDFQHVFPSSLSLLRLDRDLYDARVMR